MRLRSFVLFGSVAAFIIAPLACSGTDHPGSAGNGGGKPDPFEGGMTTSVDAGDPEAGIAANIAHNATLCGTTPCGIMGIKKSGFQELADVSFLVKNADGKPV